MTSKQIKTKFIHNLFYLFAALFWSNLPYAATNRDVQDIDIIVDKNNSFEINKNIFGIHGALLWSPVRYWDEELVRIYKDIGFFSIRFPGGTDANYYLWKQSEYGCNKDVDNTSKASERIKKFNRSHSMRGLDYTTTNFIKFLNRSHTDFTLVINIMCDSLSEAIDWLKYFRENNVRVEKVELGNELYFEEYANKFPSPEDYVREAERFAQALKNIDPRIKIGMVVSSSSFRSKNIANKNYRLEERHKRGILFDKLVAKSSFADALVIHLYSHFGITHIENAREDFFDGDAYKRAISHFDTRTPFVSDYLNKLAPDKEIWVTEWGLAYYGELRKFESDFNRSFLNGLFIGNALVTLLNAQQFTNAYYHNFPNLMQKAGGNQIIPAYEIMKIFKTPIESSQRVAKLSFSNYKSYSSLHKDFKGNAAILNGVYLYSDSDGYLILVNKFSDNFSIGAIKYKSGIKMDWVSSEVLKLSQKVSENIFLWEGSKKFKSESKLLLPPYSITKIKFEVE